MKVIQPPDNIFTGEICPRVFLAGTIDMGNSVDWQAEVAQAFSDFDELTFYNPRRDSWDSSWKQSLDNPHFVRQVEWELMAMKHADIIFMHFLPGSQSPITMLEMGMYANSKKLLVCCPDGFYRKGNIDIVCNHYGIPHEDDLDLAIELLRNKL